MEIKHNSDGTVQDLPTEDGNGTVTEVYTAEQADVVQAEIVQPEQAPAAPSGRAWRPLASQQKAPEAPAPTQAATGAVPAVVPRYAPPTRPPASVEVSDNAISLGEIIIPTLNVVQGVGALVENFDSGTIVFDKKFAIANPPKKSGPNGAPATSTPDVNLILIGFRPVRYAEKLEGGDQGRIFNTEADVYNNGGTTDYASSHEGTKLIAPYFQPLTTALMLVEAPKDFDKSRVEEVFPYECQDGDVLRRYAVCQWHLRGASYTAAARPLKTARKLGSLRKGYTTKRLSLTVAWKKFGGDKGAFVPTVVIGQDTSENQRQLAAEVLESLTSA